MIHCSVLNNEITLLLPNIDIKRHNIYRLFPMNFLFAKLSQNYTQLALERQVTGIKHRPWKDLHHRGII